MYERFAGRACFPVVVRTRSGITSLHPDSSARRVRCENDRRVMIRSMLSTSVVPDIESGTLLKAVNSLSKISR